MHQSNLPQGVSIAQGQTSKKSTVRKLPRKYGDLDQQYTVSVRSDAKNGGPSNIGIGQFPISKIPDGRYRIYYFRPKYRERLLGNGASSAQDKIKRVGKGQEFYIFDKNGSSNMSNSNKKEKESEKNSTISPYNKCP